MQQYEFDLSINPEFKETTAGFLREKIGIKGRSFNAGLVLLIWERTLSLSLGTTIDTAGVNWSSCLISSECTECFWRSLCGKEGRKEDRWAGDILEGVLLWTGSQTRNVGLQIYREEKQQKKKSLVSGCRGRNFIRDRRETERRKIGKMVYNLWEIDRGLSAEFELVESGIGKWEWL